MRVARGFGLVVALLGCGEVTRPGTIGESGTLSFSYTGAGGAASYSATGALPSNSSATLGATPWAAGTIINSNQAFEVFASVPHASTWDVVSVTIAAVSNGTSSIAPSCTASGCTDVTVLFGSAGDKTGAYAYQCILTSGSVTLTSMTSSHAIGTFSGSGSCLSFAGVSSAFTVSNGAFSVGITTNAL
jgi:hypothetical protein